VKLGVSISTHSSDQTPIERYDVIENCFQSLVDNNPGNIEVNIISDGITEKHRKIIEKFPFNHIERTYNGGIAKTKNTSIKTILEQGCDIGFLSDDDMIFKDKELFNAYTEAIIKTEIPHYCLFLEANGEKDCHVREVNGFEIKQTPWVNGCFLTFTKEMIEQIGYFKVMSYKYGHEHSNFTLRCRHKNITKFHCDILNSSDYITIDKGSLAGINSMGEIDQELFNQNGQEYNKNLGDYIEIIE
jgi:hypothetical protein